MNFSLFKVFSRAATVELDSGTRYEAPEGIEVFLNGERIPPPKTNVFTLFSLTPATEYRLSAKGPDGKTTSASFFTEEESAFINVKDIGAAGDGKTDDTEYISAAIAMCPEGGTVYVPAGTYSVRPLFMKSHMTLYLGEGARLVASADQTAYPLLPGVVRKTEDWNDEFCFGSWEGNPLDQYASLITALRVSDFSLIGEGTLDGNGQAGGWWKDPKHRHGAWRPNVVFLNDCKNVTLCGVTVKNSPCWTIHPYYSDDVDIVNVKIENPDDSPNTDGIDPQSCRRVTIVGTKISVGDDCIAIKSGKLYMAHAHFRRTEDIEVRNCFFERGHGGVTIGSEAACGVSDVRVSKSIFKNTDRGLRIKTRRGRGEKSLLTGIDFHDLTMDGVRMPFTVNMFYFCDPDGHTPYVQDQTPRPVDSMTPAIGSIRISDVAIENADVVTACIYGLPEKPVASVTIEDVTVSYRPPSERTPGLAVMMDDFPEMSGQSLYINNVDRLLIRNLKISGEVIGEPEFLHIGEQEVDGLYISHEEKAKTA